MTLETRLSDLYHRVYEAVCGKHPYLRPWHSEWLATKDLYADLRRVLPTIEGCVLDVGCGDKPYRAWMGQVPRYVGLDACAGPQVDVVARGGEAWPFEENSFDCVLCTQVLEHVTHLEDILAEIRRVLRPGGVLIATLPFIFHEHGAPEDYRRFSLHGARRLFRDYQLAELKPQGGIGSTLGLLWLGWIDLEARCWPVTRFLKGAVFPLWVVLCGLVNLLGYLLDHADRTGAFYTNLMVVARKASD